MIKRGIVSAFAIILVLAPLMQLANPIPVAVAQSSTDPWTIPINLSQSGSTIEPSMVMDSKGVIHAIWYDLDDEYIYTRLENNEWRKPIKANFPFERGNAVRLLSDSRGFITAFWINKDKDLSYSYIPASVFGQGSAWSRIQTLGEGVEAFDVTMDSKGSFHVAYVRSEEADNIPAGIYYRSAKNSGSQWSNSVLLDESRYYRSVDPRTAHVEIITTQLEENEVIYLAWDNRSVKQIYLAKSTDGGKQWDEPALIDGPTVNSPNEDPFHIIAYPYGKNLLLIWSNGLQSGFDCTQYSQLSSDMGATWLDRQVMLEKLVGCPQDSRFFALDDGALLMTTVQDQVLFLAWNGTSWSDPQNQSPISSFSDPTTFKTVLFRCVQPVLAGRQLYVLGCDQETGGGGDVWFTSRSLDPLADWYEQAKVWSESVPITTEQSNITSPEIVCDPDSHKHVFWSQTIGGQRGGLDRAIYYAKLDENGWTQPIRLLATPDNRAVQPFVANDDSGRLISVWSSDESGSVYFSVASAATAQNAFNWSNPVLLPAIQPAASSPQAWIDKSGKIFVVYAITLNEDRGIYLTRSDDGGKTWTSPKRLFDAVAYKWYLVDHPNLTQTSDGVFHLVFLRYSLPGGIGAIALYYARSDDEGETWSQPQPVIEDPLEWGRILATDERTVHRFWVGIGKNSGIWHEFSIDSGQTWSLPDNLSKIGETIGPTEIISDKQGRLHLFQAVADSSGTYSIKYDLWNGARWSVLDTFDLENKDAGQITSLGACIDSKDQLYLVYSLIRADKSTGIIQESINSISRPSPATPVEAPTSMQFFNPTNTLTPTIETTATGVITAGTTLSEPVIIEPTPTAIVLPKEGGGAQTNTSILDQPWVGLVLGLVLALFIVIAAFVLILRRRRQHDYYG